MGKIDTALLGIPEQDAIQGGHKAYIKDVQNGKCYVIPEGKWTVGRKADIDLDIPIETEDLYMSRNHAYITLRQNIIGENVLYICDFAQRANPTHVDGYKIECYYDFQLFDGSTIEMGYSKFKVHLNPLNT